MVARQLCRRSVLATDAGRRADKIMKQTLMGEPPKPSPTSRWSVGMSRASRSATPTSSRALTHGSGSAVPTNSKRTGVLPSTRAGRQLANAEGAASRAPPYRAGTAPSQRST